jgi:putative metalloprotease
MAQILLILVAAAAIAYVQFRMGMRTFERQLASQSTPLDDPELEAAIRRLGALAGAPEVSVRVFDMPAVNALATPEGRIYLTNQLARQRRMGLLSVAEAASVVAHELGHVALGHHRRRMIDWTGQSAVRIGLGLVLNRFLPLIGFFIADLLGRAVIARLSRHDEFEADRYATALMIRAGYGPEPQITMFEKLARIAPDPRGAAWMASHPPVSERIAAIEANASAWSAA